MLNLHLPGADFYNFMHPLGAFFVPLQTLWILSLTKKHPNRLAVRIFLRNFATVQPMPGLIKD